jgi:hypothetical protein
LNRQTARENARIEGVFPFEVERKMNITAGNDSRSVFAQFVLAWLAIIAVASFDSYLTVKHSPVMDDVEINPVGALVLRSAGGVPLMIGMKTAGVALALLFCVSLWQCERLRSKVLFSTYSVATLAIGMVGFMHYDAVGMQTRRWAEEESARLANSPATPAKPATQTSEGKRDIPLSLLKLRHAPTPDLESEGAIQAVACPVSIDSIRPDHEAGNASRLMATAENADGRKPQCNSNEAAAGSDEQSSISI